MGGDSWNLLFFYYYRCLHTGHVKRDFLNEFYIINSAFYYRWSKILYVRLWKKEKKAFILDQILHGIILLLTSYIMVVRNIPIVEMPFFREMFTTFNVSEIFLVSWILSVLLIYKPANIFIQVVLSDFRPAHRDEGSQIKNAGRFIGTVERIIMLIFLSLNQYAALGLVLTAKSIARYDKIAKDKDFAEYYLLGTLLSTLIVICVRFYCDQSVKKIDQYHII
jgi:hypothetical protein